MIATKPVSTAPLLARLKPHHLLLGCILLLGALLRVYQLDRESYWVDEIITLGVAREGLLAIIEEAVGGRPPVYFLLSHVWLQLFGTAETATRLMPALISIASLPLLYMVGQQLFGRRIALIATLLLALAPIQLYQSQNIRYYSLYIFCTLLSYYCMLRALGQERRAWYVAYVLASLLLVYVHTLAVFVVAAQNLYMLLCWRRHRASVYPWVIAQGLIMLGILPFIAGSLTRSSSAEATDVVNWVLPPPLVAPLRTLALFVSIRPPGPALILLAGLLLLLGVVLAWWQRRRPAVANEPSVPAPAQQPFNRPVLLACWLLCPILLLFAASYIVGPMYLDRYTLTASPALYLLLGLGVVALGQWIAPLLSVAALVTLMAPGLAAFYNEPLKEQWRETAAYVQAHEQPGDMLVFAPSIRTWAEQSFRWYYQGELPGCALDENQPERAAIEARLARCTAGAQRLWVIASGPEPLNEPFLQVLVEQPGPGVRLVEQRSFVGVEVYLVEWKGSSASSDRINQHTHGYARHPVAPGEFDAGACKRPMTVWYHGRNEQTT